MLLRYLGGRPYFQPDCKLHVVVQLVVSFCISEIPLPNVISLTLTTNLILNIFCSLLMDDKKMVLNVTLSESEPSVVVHVAAQMLQDPTLSVDWGKETKVAWDGGSTTQVESLLRFLSRKNNLLYGSTALAKTEVDHWLLYSSKTEFNSEAFEKLNHHLRSSSYLVEDKLTFADLAVYEKLRAHLCSLSAYPHVQRWFKFIDATIQDYLPQKLKSQEVVIGGSGDEEIGKLKGKHGKAAAGGEPVQCGKGDGGAGGKSSKKKENGPTDRKSPDKNNKENSPSKKSGNGDDENNEKPKDEGKFVDLPGAEMGKVVTRFPPEASGFLHIGHAKAALLNQYYQQLFQGKLIMRFDDTNPAKESLEFEEAILKDLATLKIFPDQFTYTSSHFDVMLDLCEKLIRDGNAYADDTDPETMKAEREARTPSKNRDNTPAANLALWEEMKKGTPRGQQCCIRAKIDMSSPNGCLRDPTIYRCKPEHHPKTGDKYKAYPTYDFACPIVDSIEGVTHALRTTEYLDRDTQYYWFIDILGIRKPYIYSYSRLNLTNTVLSKRKLTWFVDQKLVDGWDDPRFPTVRGILRRGMTVEGLRQFIIAQGSSRSVVVMGWDKIWAFNRGVIDPIVPRHTALTKVDRVPVHVKGVQETSHEAAAHPKNPDVGKRIVWTSPTVWVEESDAVLFKEGENVTFINWGNLKITKVTRTPEGGVSSVEAEPNLDDKNFKKTLKITWLAETAKSPLTPVICVYFDHIISKPVLGKDDDFKNFIGKDTRITVDHVGDSDLQSLKKGDIIQLQRKGFFICDIPYEPRSPHSCKESPIILFAIPDGHIKEMPTAKIPKSQNPVPASSSSSKSASSNGAGTDIKAQIEEQGNKVRSLKGSASKDVIDAEVKVLLALKAKYKEVTGQDYDPPKAPSGKKGAQSQPPAQAVKTETTSPTGAGDEIKAKIEEQGNKVRTLKGSASKGVIDAEVKVLLALKAKYKEVTGQDYDPPKAPSGKKGAQSQQPAQAIKTETTSSTDVGAEIKAKIEEQGNKVRSLKGSASKDVIDAEVKVLLALKAKYKEATGQDYDPPKAPSGKKGSQQSQPPAQAVKTETSPAPSTTDAGAEIKTKIEEQGNKVRSLKGSASKDVIDAEVKVLLALKAKYKEATGLDYDPPKASSGKKDAKSAQPAQAKKPTNPAPAPTPAPSATATTMSSDAPGAEIKAQIEEQGNKVRSLKGSASKDVIDAEVKVLLALKAKYKEATGQDYDPPKEARGGSSGKKDAKKEKENKKPAKGAEGDSESTNPNLKKVTRLGLEAKKSENLSDWFTQVITKSEMIEYYDVSGCYILRPWSYAIWEAITKWFDAEIKKLGVTNAYFPMFVSQAALEKEKSHIADFAPEVAWVTKSGNTEMAEPVAIRPTSETVMYPAFAKWVQSYRDLPLKINQWNSVVRWEFKHPQPFLRTREFLWQEGHSAFATYKEAEEEVYQILDLYTKVYTDLLAIPVVPGRKTEKEKFPGGDFTTTVEAFVSASGRGLQGGTSHHLGQNFSKMFEIVFDDPETQEKRFAYQNSWGLSTRTIGAMVMVHSDDQGIVLPPRVAAIQVVIIPCGITASLSVADKNALYDVCKTFEQTLLKVDIRAKADLRDNYSPGWKYNHWELKGVPIRIDIGPRDLKEQKYVAVRRDNGVKAELKQATLTADIQNLLDTIHKSMFDKANGELQSHTTVTEDWKTFCDDLDKKRIIMAPFCGAPDCEDTIKKDSAKDEPSEPGAPAMGAKSLCIPFKQPKEVSATTKCINKKCTSIAKNYTLFGRSY